MIHPLQRTNIVTVKDDLTLQLVPILLDMVVLDHDDHHVHFIKEAVEVKNLVLNYFLFSIVRVEALERPSEVALLAFEHLEGGRFADIVHILLVSDAVQAHAAVVGDAVLMHDLVDAIEYELRLAVIGLHAFVNDLGEARIIAHEEPGIDRNAMSADSGAGLKNVHARVHVADTDDLVDVHIVVTTDARKLVRKGDVDCAEGVLNDLGHFRCADVGYHDLTLAEGLVVLLDLFAYGSVVGADGAVVMEKLVHHVAGNDAFGSMDEVDLLAGSFHYGANRLIDGTGADCGLNHDGGPFGADLDDFLDRCDDVTSIYFLAELVVRGGDADDVGICLLIFCGELDSLGDSCLEKFVQAVLFECGLAGIQGVNEFFVIIRSNDFHSVGSHHKCRGQSDVAQSDYVDHILLFHFISVYGFTSKGFYDAAARFSVAVRIHGLGHLFVGLLVVEQGADFVNDEVVIRSYQMDCTAFEGLGALGGVAHHEDGLAQAGSLFLDAAGVGEDQGALLHQVYEFQILEGFDEEEVGPRKVFAEHFVDGLADIGIEVHRINEIHLRVFLR